MLSCLYAKSLLQVNGSSILHNGQQLSSPLQLHQRHESSFDERHKSTTSSNDVKPLLSAAVQPVAVPVGDAPSIQKVCLFTHFFPSRLDATSSCVMKF